MSSITSILGKRDRPPFSQHFYPSGPGVMPSVSDRPSGPSVPPPRALGPPQLGINIPVQSQSTTKYLKVNPTGSIPVMIRPWQDLYEKDYNPGCLIFCKQDKVGRSPLVTCADLPTMNYLLTQGYDPNETPVSPWDYEFLGVFRNDAGKQVDRMGFPAYTNIKQRLIQCDVYGRTKVANMWSRKLKTGDLLEICLVPRMVSMRKKPNRNGRSMPKSLRFQLVPTVNGCLPDTNTKLNRYVMPNKTDNPSTITGKDVYIRKWRVGIVSQSAYEPPTAANIRLAMHDSQQRTHLPQIEVLMI